MFLWSFFWLDWGGRIDWHVGKEKSGHEGVFNHQQTAMDEIAAAWPRPATQQQAGRGDGGDEYLAVSEEEPQLRH